MRNPSLSLFIVATAMALVAGCASTPVGPDYAAPEPLSSMQAASAGPFLSSAGVAADIALPPAWWRLYQEPQLDALVEEALKHNTDLRQSLANLEREQALEAEMHGAERPTMTAHGGPGFGHASGLALLQKDSEPPSRFTYSAGVGRRGRYGRGPGSGRSGPRQCRCRHGKGLCARVFERLAPSQRTHISATTGRGRSPRGPTAARRQSRGH